MPSMGSEIDASGATGNSVSGAGGILPVDVAVRRTELDRGLLMDEVNRRSDESGEALTSPYRVAGGPLGDSCDSLRDLVAHVLMWDEINLAVLTEARLGRKHWSLDSHWESPAAGRLLNASGVAAGRALPVSLLLQRFVAVRDSVLAELAGYAGEAWLAPLSRNAGLEFCPGSLAEYVMTVPKAPPYWHAAIHLDRLMEDDDHPASRSD
jgi:hypothetical protein